MSANKANIVYGFKTSIHTKKQMSRLSHILIDYYPIKNGMLTLVIAIKC